VGELRLLAVPRGGRDLSGERIERTDQPEDSLEPHLGHDTLRWLPSSRTSWEIAGHGLMQAFSPPRGARGACHPPSDTANRQSPEQSIRVFGVRKGRFAS